MKRFTQLTLIAAVIVSCNLANAQVPYLNSTSDYANQIAQLKANHPKIDNSQRAIFSMYLDYATAAGDNSGGLMNLNNQYLSTDTALTYCAVVFDQVAGYTDPTNATGSIVSFSDIGLPSAYPSNLAITIDSLFFIGSHENNSGQMDYIKPMIVTTSGTGAPTSTVLWSSIDSSNFSLSSNGNWTGTGAAIQFGYSPAFTTTAGQKIGVVVDYSDASKLDSFGVIGTGVDLDGDDAADAASTYANSYSKFLYVSANLLKNANLVYTGGGAFLLQNWNVWLRITMDYPLGVSDAANNLSVNSVYPNPANANANIHFFLENSSNLEINVVDIAGKQIQSVYNGSMTQGHHDMQLNTSNLPSGIYFVSMVAANGSPVVSKLVVSH